MERAPLVSKKSETEIKVQFGEMCNFKSPESVKQIDVFEKKIWQERISQQLYNYAELSIVEMKTFIFHKIFNQGIYNELIRVSERFENPSRYWFGTTLAIIISSPEDMQVVLNSPHCLQKPYMYAFVDEDGNGLFHAKGKLFHRQTFLFDS